MDGPRPFEKVVCFREGRNSSVKSDILRVISSCHSLLPLEAQAVLLGRQELQAAVPVLCVHGCESKLWREEGAH